MPRNSSSSQSLGIFVRTEPAAAPSGDRGNRNVAAATRLLGRRCHPPNGDTNTKAKRSTVLARQQPAYQICRCARPLQQLPGGTKWRMTASIRVSRNGAQSCIGLGGRQRAGILDRPQWYWAPAGTQPIASHGAQKVACSRAREPRGTRSGQSNGRPVAFGPTTTSRETSSACSTTIIGRRAPGMKARS